jgi:hypothetical protein
LGITFRKENIMQEIWKDIVGYEGLYQVSNFGRVYSIEKDMFFSCGAKCKNNNYVHVILYKDGMPKQHCVHRLVAQAFIPNPDNLPIVHHIDTNKKNNCVNNLQWCTQKENVTHCIESGKFGKSWGLQKYKLEQKEGRK